LLLCAALLLSALILPGMAVAEAEIRKIEDLSGKKVGVLAGSVFDKVLLDRVPDAEPVYFSNYTDQIAAIKAGKIVAFMQDEPMGRYMCNSMEGLSYLEEYFRAESYALALPMGSTELQAEVNRVLAELKADGTWEEIDNRWFGTDEEAKQLPELEFSGEKGTIRFATNSGSAPFAYLKNGEIVGYDIEMAMHICSRLGYKLEITDSDFGGILPGLSSGRYDLAGACITVTEERKQSVLFADPSYTGGIVAMVYEEPQQSGGFWASLTSGFHKTFILEGRWKLFAEGLGVTLLISVLSAIFGTVLGFGVCMARRAKNRILSTLARGFIRLIQGIPVLVFLMILFYLVLVNVKSGVVVAVIGFSINFAAYVAEMMRMGIDTVDKGQLEASSALGFSKVQTFTKITAPQAVRYVLPVHRGEFISLVKTTSVVGYIAIQDLTRMSDLVRSLTFDAFFSLISTAIIYFVLANLLAALLGMIEVKVDPKRRKREVKGVKMV